MARRIRARDLLRTARAVYDAPGCPLPRQAAGAWRGGFAAGGAWMGHALGVLRRTPAVPAVRGLQALGCVKYGLATAAGVACVVPAIGTGWYGLLFLGPLAFYAVEAQMVFLFPLALDGEPKPLRTARRWTVRAGGTVAVVRTVLPLAVCMLLGGFAGRGFVRSWCLGCLAVCVWYETLRVGTQEGTPP